MSKQTPEQLGICSWSTKAQSPQELIERLDQLELKKVQLALNPLRDASGPWQDTQKLLHDKGYTIVSGMYGTVGESYKSLESIRATGGLVPDETWEQNWQIVQDVAKIAQDMKLSMVSGHAGFLPHDKNDPQFEKLLKRVSKVAHCFKDHGISLIFETGQETADTLLDFLAALDGEGATNTGVNFDPANMILYDMGDPIQSLKKLMPRVQQVHIKDAVRTKVPGTWGKEVAIGQGEVDWPAFIRTLNEGNYSKGLIIEREAGEDRVGDVRIAIDYMSKVMQQA